jgi:hypothetical protein
MPLPQKFEQSLQRTVISEIASAEITEKTDAHRLGTLGSCQILPRGMR